MNIMGVNNYVDEAFGKILRKMREYRKLSQREFAKLCNIDKTYYGHLELGRHSITLVKLDIIAQALDITVQDLLSELPS